MSDFDALDAMSVYDGMMRADGPFKQGRRAAAAGIPFDDNPYANDVQGVDPCNRAHAWALGYLIDDDETACALVKKKLFSGVTAEEWERKRRRMMNIPFNDPSHEG